MMHTRNYITYLCYLPNTNKNINFNGIHTIDISEKNPSVGADCQYLNHTTQFFRYGNKDEYMLDILRKEGSKKNINVICAGCSYGEEVYSLAMELDDLKYQPLILGVDVSQKAIDGAKNGTYILDSKERKLFEHGQASRFEYTDNNKGVELKSKFKKNFKLVDSRLNKYQKKEDAFKNCQFICENITSLDKICQKNSQDAILCRLVLYHLSDEDENRFFEQAYKVLKPGGILCLDPYGYTQYEHKLKSIGFEKSNENLYDRWIYKKPKQKIKTIDYMKHFMLRHKLYFNNI